MCGELLRICWLLQKMFFLFMLGTRDEKQQSVVSVQISFVPLRIDGLGNEPKLSKYDTEGRRGEQLF